MPVSKNKRKNAQAKKRQHLARLERQKRLNSAPVVLAQGLKGFDVVLENVRQVSNMYVRVTKAIPDYQETNPDLLPGLAKAIPILKEVIATRDKITEDVKRLHQAGVRDQLEYMDCMQAFEAMTIRLGVDFMDEFMPIFDCLEELGEKYSGVDLELVTGTRKQLQEHKPVFKTDLGIPMTDTTKSGQSGPTTPLTTLVEEASAE
ncbi:hypothetical protein RBD99_002892 [Salmonella enterica]|nr:hypothetical protein [Salmonella enterica]